jgi:hypothetical protein
MNTYISLPKTISNNKLNNKLIVDFPRHGRRTVSFTTSVEASNNAVSTTLRRRRVRFSHTSQLVVIDNVSQDDRNKAIYSRDDYKNFERELRSDFHQMSHAFSSMPLGDILCEDLYKCIGIESFVSSRDLA